MSRRAALLGSPALRLTGASSQCRDTHTHATPNPIQSQSSSASGIRVGKQDAISLQHLTSTFRQQLSETWGYIPMMKGQVCDLQFANKTSAGQNIKEGRQRGKEDLKGLTPNNNGKKNNKILQETIHNHNNPIGHKALYPILRQSKHLRPHSEDNKHTHPQLQQEQPRRTSSLSKHHHPSQISNNMFQIQNKYKQQHVGDEEHKSCENHSSPANWSVVGGEDWQSGASTPQEADRAQLKKSGRHPQPIKALSHIQDPLASGLEICRKRESKFYEKCFQHIMIQNSCLTKQVLMKEIELRRLKEELIAIKQTYNRTPISLNTPYMDIISEEDSSRCSHLTDESPSPTHNANIYESCQQQQHTTLNPPQTIPQSYANSRTRIQNQTSLNSQHDPSINQFQKYQTIEQNQRFKFLNTNRSDPIQLENCPIRYFSNPPIGSSNFQISNQSSLLRQDSPNDTDELSIKQINKLIEQIEQQQQQLKLRQTNSWIHKQQNQQVHSEDGESGAIYRKISIEKQVEEFQKTLHLQKKKLQIQQLENGKQSEKIFKPINGLLFFQKNGQLESNEINKQVRQQNLIERTHKLQGLDFTRLDRLRMKKGLVTRKNMADNLSLVSSKKENDINKKT